MALFEGFRPQGEALVLLLIIYCSEIFCFFPVCRLANLMFYSRVKHSGTIISAPGESELKAPSRSDSIRIILGRDCFYCLNQYPETAQFSRTHCCRAGDVWDCGSSYYLNQCPEIAQTSHILLPCRRCVRLRQFLLSKSIPGNCSIQSHTLLPCRRGVRLRQFLLSKSMPGNCPNQPHTVAVPARWRNRYWQRRKKRRKSLQIIPGVQRSRTTVSDPACLVFCGERGIRTPGTVTRTAV